MRLEQDQETAGKRMQRGERGGNLVWIVREVVDYGYAARRADDLQPAANAREPRQRIDGTL